MANCVFHHSHSQRPEMRRQPAGRSLGCRERSGSRISGRGSGSKQWGGWFSLPILAQRISGCVKAVWSSYYGISSDSRIEHWYIYDIYMYMIYDIDMYTWGIIGDINQQDDMGLISLKIRWPRNLSLRPATDWASSVGPNRGWTASMAQGTTSSLIFSKYGYQWLPYGRVDRVILGKSWTTNSPHIDELFFAMDQYLWT